MKKKDVPVGENSGVPAEIAAKTKEIAIIDEDLLKSKVYTIRGVKVMLDADLAEIYGYSVKAFNQQVKNNSEKFPEDFRFQLSREDLDFCSRSKILTLNGGSRGSNLKYRPYAFTEQGIYMLAAENQQLLGCANCVQIAALTAQNSKEIAEIRSDFNVFRNETQESLGKVTEYFHDPSTYRHRAIVTSLNRIEHPEVYHSLMEEVLLLPDLP